MNRSARAIGVATLAVALLSGCTGSSGDAVAGSSSPASSKVDPIVGTWVASAVTLKIAADGSFGYTQRLVQGRPPSTTTGTWKPSGDGYTWEFSHPHAKLWGFWVFPDIGTKGTWHLSQDNTLEQSPGPHTTGTSYTRSPGS